MATSAQIRQQLVDALHSDLIGPSLADDVRHCEKLPQPPSVWYTTGFLVPHVLQQDAGRPPGEGEQKILFSDLAGEATSNDAAKRLERDESSEDASNSQDQDDSSPSWFPSSLGLSFILERGSTLEATVSWGDYTPADGDDSNSEVWLRSPKRKQVTLKIDRPSDDNDEISLEDNCKGLCLRWLAKPAPETLGYPSDHLSISLFLLNKRQAPSTKRIDRDLVSAFQVELSLKCQKGFPPRLDALRLADKDDDEKLAALQYRQDYCFAIGHNVAVVEDQADSDQPGRCYKLTTTWMPTAKVYHTLPEPSLAINTSVPKKMEDLANLAKSEKVIECLMPMVQAYRSWMISKQST